MKNEKTFWQIYLSKSINNCDNYHKKYKTKNIDKKIVKYYKNT
jgi:hypothetical protein